MNKEEEKFFRENYRQVQSVVPLKKLLLEEKITGNKEVHPFDFQQVEETKTPIKFIFLKRI